MHRSWKTSFGYILQFGVHLSSNFPVIFTLCILTRPEDYATVLRLGLVPSAGHRTPICAPAWRQHGHFLFPRYSQSHSSKLWYTVVKSTAQSMYNIQVLVMCMYWYCSSMFQPEIQSSSWKFRQWFHKMLSVQGDGQTWWMDVLIGHSLTHCSWSELKQDVRPHSGESHVSVSTVSLLVNLELWDSHSYLHVYAGEFTDPEISTCLLDHTLMETVCWMYHIQKCHCAH